MEHLLAQTFAVFVMLAILSILILVHEFGHFSVARFFGFQTPVFGFGLPFGPYAVLGKKWGTEFRVYACLLGGFVAIPELGDESSTHEETFGLQLKPFRKFPIWQRICVALAGVTFNVIFAYFVMAAMLFSFGEPTQPTIVHSLIESNPIAKEAGIHIGDQIREIDGYTVTTTDEAVHLLVARKMQEVSVKVIRDGKDMLVPMTTNKDGKVGMALVSKGPISYHKVDGGFFNVLLLAGERLWVLTASMLDAMGQMVVGVASGGHAGGVNGQPAFSVQDLHGVLAVIKIGADIAQQDWSQLFLFTIMISVDLAIINVLPWPALDGWHVFAMLIEAVRGKPMHDTTHGEIVKWGFISLLVLMAVVMVNDITALVTGKLDLKKKDKTQIEAPVDEKPSLKTPPAEEALKEETSKNSQVPAPATP